MLSVNWDKDKVLENHSSSLQTDDETRLVLRSVFVDTQAS